MKRPRFSEDEILQILQEHKSGQTAAELCRKYRISDTTFYKWRARRGLENLPETRCLKRFDKHRTG
ncbi:transposase [Roseibium sp.]|uniref:transposase n=1 Tax=Roseibium sp. TaxID=1936156 RepID=UPI003D0BC5E5